MRSSLNEVCNKFIENRDVIKKCFILESAYMIPGCASEFCKKRRVISEEALEESKRLVNKNTGILSNFRGNIKLPLICLLANSSDPAQLLSFGKKVYEGLKEEFWGSEYLALASILLAQNVDESRVSEYAERGKRLYNEMKANHPFLTSSEDSVFAILMSVSDKSDDELIAEMEQIYTRVRGGMTFESENAIQTVSHILAMAPGTADQKSNRFLKIFNTLRDKGFKYGKGYELGVLAAVSILEGDVEEIVQDIADADALLESQKGYGIGLVGLDKKTRLMHAAMLVSCDRSEGLCDSASAITGALAIIAAQEAALMIVMASSVAISANS